MVSSEVIKKLIEISEKDKKFHSYNGKSIFNLPLHVPVGISITDFLSDTFVKYQNLLKESRETYKYGRCTKFRRIC